MGCPMRIGKTLAAFERLVLLYFVFGFAPYARANDTFKALPELSLKEGLFAFTFDNKPTTNRPNVFLWDCVLGSSNTLITTNLILRRKRLESTASSKGSGATEINKVLSWGDGISLVCTATGTLERGVSSLMTLGLKDEHSSAQTLLTLQARSLLLPNQFPIDYFRLSLELVCRKHDGSTQTLAAIEVRSNEAPFHCGFGVSSTQGILVANGTIRNFIPDLGTVSSIQVSYGSEPNGIQARIDSLLGFARCLTAEEFVTIARPLPTKILSISSSRTPLGEAVYINVRTGEPWRSFEMLRFTDFTKQGLLLPPTLMGVFQNPTYTEEGLQFMDSPRAHAFYLFRVE